MEFMGVANRGNRRGRGAGDRCRGRGGWGRGTVARRREDELYSEYSMPYGRYSWFLL